MAPQAGLALPSAARHRADGGMQSPPASAVLRPPHLMA